VGIKQGHADDNDDDNKDVDVFVDVDVDKDRRTMMEAGSWLKYFLQSDASLIRQTTGAWC